MQGLARFVIKGRLNAAIAALLCSALPLLTFLAGAVLALVTLRKGATEGGIVTVAALAPLAYSQDWLQASPYLTLVAVYVAAMVLRQSIKLNLSVVVLVACIALLVGLIPGGDGESWRMLEQLLRDNLSQQGVMEQITEGERDQALHSVAVQLMGVSWLMLGLSGLFLGRYWQALLFNPGGFRREFHNLRLHPWLMLGLMTAVLVATELNSQWQATSILFLTPPVLAGLGLVHWWVAYKRGGIHWLVLLYLSLFLFNALPILVLVVVALLDSFLDFRKRVPPPSSPQ